MSAQFIVYDSSIEDAKKYVAALVDTGFFQAEDDWKWAYHSDIQNPRIVEV